MRTRSWRIAAAAATVATLAAVIAVVVWRDQVPTRELTADFTSTVGVHDGSDVRVLGVKIGRVVAVRPEGQTVRVEMRYDARYPIPSDVRAVIIPPSVVSDRYVQLTPAYTTARCWPTARTCRPHAPPYRSNSTTSTARSTHSTARLARPA